MSADGPVRGGDPTRAVASMPNRVPRVETQKTALEVFNSLDALRPLPVPPKPNFEDPAALDRWQKGGQIADNLIEPFAVWLESMRRRTMVIGENERRLRVTTWAQVKIGRTGDYAQHFADFHRREWGIAHVCEDSAEREQQVQAVARNGKR